MGQVLIGRPWNLTSYVKGSQHQIFLDNGPLTSKSVLVQVLVFCPGPLVP